jgi:integrase
VFVGPKENKLFPTSVTKIFIREVIQPLSKEFPAIDGQVGFVHGRIHSFRHVFVSQSFLHGVSDGVIRDWVGHRDSRIVNRYRHLGDRDSQRKMDDIDFFRPPNKKEDKPSDDGTA